MLYRTRGEDQERGGAGVGSRKKKRVISKAFVDSSDENNSDKETTSREERLQGDEIKEDENEGSEDKAKEVTSGSSSSNR